MNRILWIKENGIEALGRRKYLLWVLVSLLSGGFILWNAAGLSATRQKQEYVFDTSLLRDVSRPGAGFYEQIDSGRMDVLQDLSCDVDLFLISYDLYDYANRRLNEEKIEELRAILDAARAANVKIILRPGYGFAMDHWVDADSLDRICEHIGQIAEVVNTYTDTVVCLQAGFLGPWGEWHDSAYLSPERSRNTRYRILTALAAKLDEEIVISLRTPEFIRDAWDMGMDPARFGYYNDGLLSSVTDYGTYNTSQYDREEELCWIDANISHGYNGGEMPKTSAYSTAANAENEFRRLHLSYLNRGYNHEIFDAWKEDELEGCNAYDYITSRLGYALAVSQIGYPARLHSGFFSTGLGIDLELKNCGYAYPSVDLELEWVLEDFYGHKSFVSIDNMDVNQLGGGSSALCFITSDYLHDNKVARIGLRIREDASDEEEHYLCLSNPDIVFSHGINYILQIDKSGKLYPFRSAYESMY